MSAIGWSWACVMLVGGARAYLAHSLPCDLVVAMLLSGLLALPLLWNRSDGVFGGYAPSGAVRAGMGLLVLTMAGVAHPLAIAGLITA